jgi:membrane protein implicated in regulation of membrane protease activity
MSAAKNYLACFWGAAAFYLLCHGIALRSVNALLLFAALAPSLVVFIWWMIDRAALERRIKRLEARSDIAVEKRAVMQTDLTEVEHKLVEVETRVASAEKIKAPA